MSLNVQEMSMEDCWNWRTLGPMIRQPPCDLRSCAWLLHPNIKNQGKGMSEVNRFGDEERRLMHLVPAPAVGQWLPDKTLLFLPVIVSLKWSSRGLLAITYISCFLYSTDLWPNALLFSWLHFPFLVSFSFLRLLTARSLFPFTFHILAVGLFLFYL